MKATLKLSERVVTKQIRDFMVYHGWRAIRLQSGLFARPDGKLCSRVHVGEKGMPDYLFLKSHPRYFGAAYCVFVELKAEGKTVEPGSAQDLWAAEALRDGFEVICANSLEDYIAAYRSRFQWASNELEKMR
jgi:hypothetical protein